jgi:hypothetical protein
MSLCSKIDSVLVRFARYEVLTAVLLKIRDIRDVKQCHWAAGYRLREMLNITVSHPKCLELRQSDFSVSMSVVVFRDRTLPMWL